MQLGGEEQKNPLNIETQGEGAQARVPPVPLPSQSDTPHHSNPASHGHLSKS